MATAKVGPDTSVETQDTLDGLTIVGIFSGIGLLISLVLILGQYSPGEWFWGAG